MTEHEAPSGRANHAPVAAREELYAGLRKRRGWKMELLFGVRSFAVYTDYPYRLYVVVGPWAVTLGPWSRSSRYANGSHWHSGWHRWADDPEF